MKTKIYYGACVATDYYELDETGNMIMPNTPSYEGDGEDMGFYIVEVWSDDTHLAFVKRFETFSDAKNYADEFGE